MYNVYAKARRYSQQSSGVMVVVCYRHWKIDAARIIKLNIEMFDHESWKSIYSGVKGSKVKVTRHKNIVGVVSALL